MLSHYLRFMLATVAFVAAGSSFATDLVIYDDASENGFDQNCSFNAIVDFAETAVVHSGSDAISLQPASFGAVSWCAPGALSTTDYRGITFWVNGGASGGQDLQLVFGLTGNIVASASLATLLGAPIPANTWVAVLASFDAGAFQFAGTFDQISIQDNSGDVPPTTQPIVYVDDVSLSGRTVTGPDEIFQNGFEPSGPTNAIVIQHDVSVDSMLSECYTWHDISAELRSVCLAHNDQNGPGGTHGGEMRTYSYVTPGGTRNVTATTANGAAAAGGFGYVVSHPGGADNLAYIAAGASDDSPLGHFFAGTWTRLLEGRHHVILRFQQNYPRYYCTNYNPDGTCPAGTARTVQMPVTIDWLITTGRDHPLWTISYDLTGAPSSVLFDDSRAPYGDMAFDGNGANPDTIMGVAWGDHYAFTSTGPNPVSFFSPWDWSQPNTIPYVYLWTQNVDAEMGVVQSEDITKQDAGGYFGQFSWGHTSADGNACTTMFGDGNYLMPCDFNWPYQSINYSLDFNNSQPTDSDRLAWGAEFGFLGQATYSGNDGLNQIGWPRQSYSTYIVLDEHSRAPTSSQVIQVENAMSSILTASVGSVLTSGPAGVNRPDSRPYQPAGYNRVYGTWEVNAAANAATTTLAAGGSGIESPIFVLHNYSAALPGSVTLDGAPLAADADYFATLDAANSRLWITVNRAWSGSHSLAIMP